MRRRINQPVPERRALSPLLALALSALAACSDGPGQTGTGGGAPSSASGTASTSTTSTTSTSSGSSASSSSTGPEPSTGGAGGAGGGSAGGSGGAGGGDGGGAGGGPGRRVRIVAANTTSGSLQSYDPGEGIRIFQGLRPDIALVQEMKYGDNSDVAMESFVTEAFGPEFSYYREPKTGQVDLPNGIVSRFPIVEAGFWDDPQVSNRNFVWARIDVPGPEDLWAISVHFLTSTAADRQAEAEALVWAAEEPAATGGLLVVGGDLNTGSRTESCVATLSELVVTAAPYPADALGNDNTTAKRSKPTDWLLADPDLDARHVPVEIGASVFPAGLVFDSRVYDPLADVSPVLEGDSGADGMQHMAVVRDFVLPDAP